MKTLSAIKNTNDLTLNINGRLITKTGSEMDELLPLVKSYLREKDSKLKEDLYDIIVDKIDVVKRLEKHGILEYDQRTNQYFLKGYDHYPIPEFLSNTMIEYLENDFPVDAVVNFWKLLMTNPDKRVIDSLFKHLSQSKYAISNFGYGIGYKKVYLKGGVVENTYEKFVRESYDKIKKQKKSPRNFFIATFTDKEGYFLLKADQKPEKTVDTLKNLLEEYQTINVDVRTSSDEVYTDIHTKTFTIKIGEPVKEERAKCDSNPDAGCSNGLHIGTHEYVKNFGSGDNVVVLACLFNPANVVSVPKDCNNTKMRVCEYFPFAKLSYDPKTGSFHTLSQKFFENDYLNYEIEEIEKTLDEAKQESFISEILEERITFVDRNKDIYAQ